MITKDGFNFLTDIKGSLDALVMTGGNRLENELSYIQQNKTLSLYLSLDFARNNSDLSFLKDINFIQRINTYNCDVDYSGLKYLTNLKEAFLDIENKKQHIDFAKFSELEVLQTNWYKQFPSLSSNIKLKELTIRGFRPKTSSIDELSLPKSIETLEFTSANILNFKGLDAPKLKRLECHYSNKLASLDGIEKFSTTLEILIMDYCRKLVDYEKISTCDQLNKIILGNCGDIPSIRWISKFKKLKHFAIGKTAVSDGDVSPCFGIDYVYFSNYKHYNHKLKEFNSK